MPSIVTKRVKDVAARPVDAKRLRHRYEAIIGKNRDLFRNARVLISIVAMARWSYAALDAGAAHVVGVESERAQVEVAQKHLCRTCRRSGIL